MNRTFFSTFAQAIRYRTRFRCVGRVTAFSVVIGSSLVIPSVDSDSNQNEVQSESSTSFWNSILKSKSKHDDSLPVSSLYHNGPLPLVSNLDTQWHEWEKGIELLFTDDDYSKGSDNMRARMERIVRTTQEHVCHELEHLERIAWLNESKLNNNKPMQIKSFPRFKPDFWTRNVSGSASKKSGGLSKVLTKGRVFEKAGVSISVSSGVLPRQAVLHMTANHKELREMIESKDLLYDSKEGVEYFAASVSSVVHPRNPHAPTGHFNYRYFELGITDPETNQFIPKLFWFGGGSDLTVLFYFFFLFLFLFFFFFFLAIHFI